ISIRLGSGTAAFGPAMNFAAGDIPQALAATDFDNDGDEDLAAANLSLHQVSLLLNNGDGSFAAPASFAVGTNPRGLVAGDFNNDGSMDIATVDDLSNNVSLLIGNNDGTFAAAVSFPVGTRPFGITMGDFNGDSHLDVAAANLTSRSVSILLGNGSGAFAAAASFPTSAPAQRIATADLNADSMLDLVVGSDFVTTVAVLTGNGDGTFQAVKTFASGGPALAIAAADLNGDNFPELAAANSAATFAVLKNTTEPALTNQPPTVDAGSDQSVECAGPSGAQVQLSGMASDPDNDALTYSWTDANGNVVGTSASVQLQVALGAHIFTLGVDDGNGHTASDTVQVTVGDTAPPSIIVTLTPAVLWPANHRMVEIRARLELADSCGALQSVRLESITSNEPDRGLGHGDRPHDIQGAHFGGDDLRFWLRAERAHHGRGRVYTVRYTATDTAGNTATAEAVVRVPRRGHHGRDDDDDCKDRRHRHRRDRDDHDRDRDDHDDDDDRRRNNGSKRRR
ncbi:MAG: FG-GAP-like repeat-containing protein, partial [Candidatus Acidiferrales bacterium]